MLQAEKELAKARVDIAHEVRLAREAEAAMQLHVDKAAQRVDREIAKHEEKQPSHDNVTPQNVGGTRNTYNHNADDHLESATTTATATTTPGLGHPTNTTGVHPYDKYL